MYLVGRTNTNKGSHARGIFDAEKALTTETARESLLLVRTQRKERKEIYVSTSLFNKGINM